MFLASIILLATLPTKTAHAGDLSLIINGKSHHYDSSYDWNENNFGLGFEYQFETTSRWKKNVMANGFRDSVNRMSYMACAGLHRRLLQTHRFSGFYIDAGINAFIMTRLGYKDVAVYTASLQEWTTDASLPMEVAPDLEAISE